MSPEDAVRQGLTRERLVEAALAVINEEGLDALTMRSVANALEVKASSLYWHVRDRRELLELLAEAILDSVGRVRRRAGWRETVAAEAAALASHLARQRDANRILLEVPEALTRSDAFAALKRELESAGLPATEATGVSRLVMVYVIMGEVPSETESIPESSPVTLAIDSGSRGVLVRRGENMTGLIRAAHDRSSAAPAIVRGERVVVRRLRGVGHGELELNPNHPWSFQIQGGTWNTVLDLAGLDVRAIKFDSGAAKVDCILPGPRGVVPIELSSGVVGVALHRTSGVAVAAEISTGAVRIRLDDFSLTAAVGDMQWESEAGASRQPDRYQLRLNSGAFQVSLDSATKAVAAPAPVASVDVGGQAASALDILLDGVASRVGRS